MQTPSLLCAVLVLALAPAAFAQGEQLKMVVAESHNMFANPPGDKPETTILCVGATMGCLRINALNLTLAFGAEDWRKLSREGLEKIAKASDDEYVIGGGTKPPVTSALAKDQYGQSWKISVYDARAMQHADGLDIPGRMVPKKLRYTIYSQFAAYELAIKKDDVKIKRVLDSAELSAEIKKRYDAEPDPKKKALVIQELYEAD